MNRKEHGDGYGLVRKKGSVAVSGVEDEVWLMISDPNSSKIHPMVLVDGTT